MNIISILDVCIILILVMFFIVGFKRGVILELVSLVGIVLMFVVAYYLKNPVGNLFCYIFPFFHMSGGLDSLNILLYQAIAFILIFALLLSVYIIILKVSKVLQKIVDCTIVLLLPSKILGGVVSFIKGYILIYIMLIIFMVSVEGVNVINNSMVAGRILYDSPVLADLTSDFINTTREISKVVVDDNSKSSQEKEEIAISIMLKYNVVDDDTVRNLVKYKKINIKNIDSILNNN